MMPVPVPVVVAVASAVAWLVFRPRGRRTVRGLNLGLAPSPAESAAVRRVPPEIELGRAMLARAEAMPGPLTDARGVAKLAADAAREAGRIALLPIRRATDATTVDTLGGPAHFARANPWASGAVQAGKAYRDASAVQAGFFSEAWDATGGAVVDAGKGAVEAGVNATTGAVTAVLEAGSMGAEMAVAAGKAVAEAPAEVAKAFADLAAAGVNFAHVADLYSGMRALAARGAPALKWASAVVGLVPGIGAGPAAALAAGSALADGQPISAAMRDAAIASVPGGAMAQAVAATAWAVASGENLGDAALAGARELVPVEYGAAYDTGAAIGVGERWQKGTA